MYGILVYMLWMRNLGFGKTMDLAWFLTCMLCWTLEWHFGNAIWHATVQEAQPDFLYKERVFTAESKNSHSDLEFAENGNWNLGYAICLIRLY
jgi:hypothetical protein